MAGDRALGRLVTQDAERDSSRRQIREIEAIDELERLLARTDDLSGVILIGLDLAPVSDQLTTCHLAGAVLIGCQASAELQAFATWSGAAVFPSLGGLPYQPYRTMLYSCDDLYAEFDPARPETYQDTLDARIYRHWRETGGQGGGDMLESLARRIHDQSITEAIEDLIDERQVVAVMGGHGVARDQPEFAAVARMSMAIARSGKLMASGGGPGAMEATHVGSWMSEHDQTDLRDAIATLGQAPTFTEPGAWLAAAFAVRDRYPLSSETPISLGIPTWLYGHEPPNAFATHIAKYFANAVREDGLLTIARHGVIFTPGSAGTVQEIFQDATQNHYETAGPASPMVFFGAKFWTETLPVLPLIASVGKDRGWFDLITVTDDIDEVVAAVNDHQRPD